MESSDYLRALGRRARVLVLVPVLAAAVAIGFSTLQPKVNKSTALVLTHPGISSFGSNVGYVTAYQAALTSTAVLNSVHQQTGVPVGDLRSGLSASPTAANSISFNVTYKGTQPAAIVSQIPTAAGQAAIQALLAPQQADAALNMNTAKAQVKAATTALNNYSQRIGAFSPTQEYTSLSTEVGQLRIDVAQNAASTSHPYNTAELNQQIATIESRLKALGPKVARYHSLANAVNHAQAALATARGQVASIQQQLGSAAASGAVIAGTTTAESRVVSAAKAGVTAAVLGLLLAIGLIILLERRTFRRRVTVSVRSEAPYQPMLSGPPTTSSRSLLV